MKIVVVGTVSFGWTFVERRQLKLKNNILHMRVSCNMVKISIFTINRSQWKIETELPIYYQDWKDQYILRKANFTKVAY